MLRNDAAAITIQKNFRGFLARKKYRLNQLPDDQLESYSAFVIGNDPDITGLARFKVNEKIALVGTSCLRSILLACELGNPSKTPKIFIVDNSREVCAFWNALRTFVADEATSQLVFERKIHQFLRNNSKLYRHIEDELKNSADLDIDYPNQNIAEFFSWVFRKYKFDNIRQIIKHTSIIKQSWDDQPTFIKIKNIIALNGINHLFMYPSNIAECCDEHSQTMAVLENISALKPTLTIHTTNEKSGIPDKVFLLQDSDAGTAHQTLFGARRSQANRTSTASANDLVVELFLRSMLKNGSQKNRTNLPF